MVLVLAQMGPQTRSAQEEGLPTTVTLRLTSQTAPERAITPPDRAAFEPEL